MRDGNKQSVMTQFKRDVIKRIYECPDIIEMLDNENVDPDCPDTAENVCIFPYIKIPGTQEQVGTFIGVKADCSSISDNELYKNVLLTVVVICSVEKIFVKGQKGIRTDIIAGDISELLNWNDTFGFGMKLVSETEGVYENPSYYAKTLKFKAIRSNDIYNGVKKY